MRLSFAALVLAFLVYPLKAQAIEAYLSAGYGRGGSQLSHLTGEQNYNIEAGSGLFLIGGAIVPITPTRPHRFESQLGLGYMFQQDKKNEANRVSWSRIPVEALYMYRNTAALFRLGWGVTYHMAGKISAKGANSGAETGVKNALGWVLAAEKLWSYGEKDSGNWALGLRYVAIKYRLSKFSREANGDTLFVTFSMMSPLFP
jgi:hypothetical protein